MFQATRRRLAIWYTAVTAVFLLLFATGFYFYVRHTLIDRIDDTLHHVVEVIERTLVIEPINFPTTEDKIKLQVNIQASFRDSTDAVEDDHIDLEWFSPTGELLWSTLSEPLNIPIHANRTGETVWIINKLQFEDTNQAQESLATGYVGDVTDLRDRTKRDLTAEGQRQERRDLDGDLNAGWQENLNLGSEKSIAQNTNRVSTKPISIRTTQNYSLRQVTQRVQIGRQVLGYLRVSHPWFEVTKPIRQLILDLILGAGLTLICVAAIGWLLSGLAMKPVRESYQRLKQFTADASHELRNPIATIQTNVQVALAEPDIEPQQHQQLQVIERLTRRLGRLVDDLLFLARQDSGIVQQQWIEVPLDALLMEVIEEQQAIATTQNLSLSLEIVDLPNAEENFTLLGDWDQLARLFTNLVSNAVQYTPSGGQIQVELQLAAKNKRNSAMLNPALQIKVTDTGIGISAEALPHLFDRFYRADPARTHRSAAGSGLGLAIAKAIVENHRGQIRIDSQVDRGTAVTVTLPAHKSEASRP
ncbi:sensor histidine kinase [Microcoleus vaginatus]|uniref:sensor histidine kinase n=1 Tax=Microcoleus vaginatus TaxID=119532 RepID=UPI00020D1187|nr:integral membrane sensor signal transduction histidine kinase [Microcoleus vaginatus FGP-2]